MDHSPGPQFHGQGRHQREREDHAGHGLDGVLVANVPGEDEPAPQGQEAQEIADPAGAKVGHGVVARFSDPGPAFNCLPFGFGR